MTIDEWKQDFKSYINELQMPRDDYKGIMLYIDEGAELLKEQKAQTVLSNRVCESEPCRYIRKGFCPKCHQEVNGCSTGVIADSVDRR